MKINSTSLSLISSLSLSLFISMPAWSMSGTPLVDNSNSQLINGKREEPKPLNKEINAGKWTAHPFIAPDESYLIWDSERDGGYGGTDLYISYRQKDGSWGPAINMGDKVNSDKADFYASVTPDGKYILFNRTVSKKPLNIDIYWVDAQIIETLRPKS